jgi:hypothetical protein
MSADIVKLVTKAARAPTIAKAATERATRKIGLMGASMILDKAADAVSLIRDDLKRGLPLEQATYRLRSLESVLGEAADTLKKEAGGEDVAATIDDPNSDLYRD